MEPRIQYAKTSDGVSIAYSMLGEGTPLVAMPNLPLSHLEYAWQQPQERAWFERLAKNRRLIRYDGRGSGMSERNVTDFSLNAHVRDLVAVVERLGLDQFVLLGVMNSGPAAVAYAASNPERVTKLVLWCTFPSGEEFWRPPRMRAFRAIRETDWELYTESLMDFALGRRAGEEEARRGAEYIRECVKQEAAQQCLAALETIDVTDLLTEVRAPTLVLHRRGLSWMSVDLARGLASGIPDAQLVLLEGTSIRAWEGDDVEGPARAIEEFLGESEEAAAGAAPSGLVTIMFTDMEGSTSLTQRLGDAKAQELLRTHNGIVREALKANGGSEIKHTGDGIMASFTSASKALECAIAMQGAFAEHNESAKEPIRVRTGLNAGEPVAEEEDLFGTAVQLAARICAQAEPGQILAPIVVRELAAGKGFLFSDRGETALRGFEEPVRLYEVRWREDR